MSKIQRAMKLYGRYKRKNIIPPDAAERFAFEKNVDSRKARDIVAIPYMVKNVNMTRGSAPLSTFPYWNKKITYLCQNCFNINNAAD